MTGLGTRSALLPLLLISTVLAACTSTSGGRGPSATPAPHADRPASGTPNPSPAGHHVEIIVTTASTKTLDITYGVGATDGHDLKNVASPWSLKQDTPADLAVFGVAATVDGNPLPVTCVLILDGKVVDQHTDAGAVGCQYTLPLSTP